jgi:hypothetical protein
MPSENDVHNGAVLPASRTHVSVPVLGVEKTPCYHVPWLGFLFFNDLS